MKIAINCAFYQPRGGGIKEYIYNYLQHLAKIDDTNNYVLYVLQDQFEYAKKNLPQKFRIKTIPYKSNQTIDIISRSLFEQRFWTNEEKSENWTIFHSPFFHAPKLKRAHLILTVHDLRFIRFPETYPFLRYCFLKNKVKKSIKNADHIIAISHFTKNEIIEAFKIDDSKISVIHEAINLNRFTYEQNRVDSRMVPPVLLSTPFLLSVGHLEPRKNYNRLIKAFIQIKEAQEQNHLVLVIVGKKGHSYKKTLKLVKSRDDILYLDFVEHSLLLWLYKNAELFVFPSYYEGYGFPPLEAAALGVVSAVSNASSIPEVCGDAAFYFDPLSIEDIRSTLTRALQKGKEYETKKTILPLQLERFSWEKNAFETLKVYESLKL